MFAHLSKEQSPHPQGGAQPLFQQAQRGLWWSAEPLQGETGSSSLQVKGHAKAFGWPKILELYGLK